MCVLCDDYPKKTKGKCIKNVIKIENAKDVYKTENEKWVAKIHLHL